MHTFPRGPIRSTGLHVSDEAGQKIENEGKRREGHKNEEEEEEEEEKEWEVRPITPKEKGQ
ncbi:hypothetical protein E2C01_052743 [Portunus trituberculatus]|uniref:Uncharacterized protein n=1 Tax=Portunus trituberculatus TaxID=210409 RepID=A0A5B7GMP3_PORTR|nr:hypothetical protein [Portunus trituberculatus]